MATTLPRLLGLVLGLFGLLAACDRTGDAPPPPPPPTVKVAKPFVRDVTQHFQYSGTLSPVQQVQIRARVPGTLHEMTYVPASEVPAGTLLFRIEPEPYEIAVAAAQGKVDAAQAVLNAAQVRLQKVTQAFANNAATEIEKIETQATVDQARAELAVAESALRQAKLDQDYSVVETPIAGRVNRNLVDVGDLVGYGEPTLLTTVTQMDPIWVYFDASERIVLEYIKKQQASDIRQAPRPKVEAALANSPAGTYPFAGEVDWVDSQVDVATGTIRVRASLPNPERRLFPGLFVRLRVPFEVMPGALLVPEDAIGTDLGGKFLLVVDAEGKAQRRPVELGQAEGDLRVITSGLTAEDRVIVAGLQKARPGQPVTVGQAEAAE